MYDKTMSLANKRNYQTGGKSVFLVILFFVGVSSALILFPDRTLTMLFANAQAVTVVKAYKGWVFILSISSLIFYLVHHEISKSYQVEDALLESEKRLRVITSSARVAIIMIDSDGLITFWNPAATQIFGYTPEEAVSKSLVQLIVPLENRERFIAGLALFKKSGQGPMIGKTVEYTALRRDGETFSIELSLSSIKLGKSWHAVGIVSDITDRKRAEAEIKYQAYHDALTGLANRFSFGDRLSQTIARAQRANLKFAILFVDLDNFKNINDRLGHATGDELLKGIATRLVKCVREIDTVSRMGGDEFTMLLENIDDEYIVTTIAQRALQLMSRPYKVRDEYLHVTASVGITIYPADGKTGEELLKNADISMYHAKKLGKNKYQLFTKAMNEKVARRLDLESQMRHAVNNDEFVLYYQPKIDTQKCEITGMEALVRWRRPDGEIIPPDEFIPLAEETGLIVPIGEQVIFDACEYVSLLHDLGFSGLSMSVNLSARQLDQMNLLEVVRSTLDVTGLAPEYLCVEVTESAMMKDLNTALANLEKLKNVGVKIAIDDFGTGYSSLSHLRKLPIHELKIDRSFVRNIPDDPEDAAIVTTIIWMARALNLHVVAEGVETPAQLDFLRSLACNEIQGYLFCPPVPGDTIESMLKERKTFPA